MALFGKRKNKKKTVRGVFNKIEVNGQQVTVKSFYMHYDKDTDSTVIELAAPEIVEQLHFDEVDIELFLSDKRIVCRSAFDSAYEKGGFKIYKFIVLDKNEYYI